MSGPRRSGNTMTHKLRECLPYIAQGLKDEQIAEKLGIGSHSVRERRHRLMDITGCLTRDELIQYAKEQ